MEKVTYCVKRVGIQIMVVLLLVFQFTGMNIVSAAENSAESTIGSVESNAGSLMMPLAEGEEILNNGDFSDGLTGWSTYLADFAGVSASVSEVNGEAVITGVSGVSDQTWHIQLNQILTQEQIDTLITGEIYTITADVWSNVDGRPARLYFGEDGGSFAAALIHDFEANITPQTISQSFLLPATYGAMKLGFEAGLSADDLYIDNVSFTLGGTLDEVDAPDAAASAPTEDAADVISLFSDAYTNVAVNTWRTDWSSATYEEVDIDGNAAKKYTNLSFVGVETTGENLVDATDMDFVHVDIWTPNMETFRLKLVDWGADGGFDGGDDTEHELTFTDLTQGEWNSLKIPLADFAGLTNRAALAQYIFAGTPDGAGTLYIDNFYFSSGDAPVNTLALPVTFEDTEQEYGLTDFGGNASSIVPDPTDSGNTVAQSTKTAGSQTWAGTTIGGTQGFATAVPFTADSTTMSVRVWSPNAGIPVRLKVEDAANNTITVETEATVTMAEEWETLVFDFSNPAAGTPALNLENTYNKASIFFNFGTAGTDETYYWDDVEFGGEAPPAAPATPAGFIANTADAAGTVFLAVGPNNVGGDIVYRLFYAKSADAVTDPTAATEYNFGDTAGDGNGVNAFGFNLGGLDAGTEYTFWLYQYDSVNELLSTPASVSAVSGADAGGGDDEPTAGAPAPTEDAADVVSLFSDAYTDVAVNTWRTDWSSATYEEVEIDGNPTKKYTNLSFVGVETTGENLIDATEMDFVHVDIWTPNMETFRLKLVDWGADAGFDGGDDTEHELTFTEFTQGEWNSLKIPLSDFTGLTNRSAMAQYIFAGTPDGAGTLYIDNFYFSSDGGAVTDEIIVNGDFSDGLTNWSTYFADFAGVSGDISVTNGEAAITSLTGPTEQPWYVQLNQVFTQEQIDALTVGEVYTISMDVRSSVDGRSANVFFGEDGGGFASVTGFGFTANTTTETVTHAFEMTATYEAMKLGIEAGLSNDDLFVDNVSLTMGGEVQEPDAPTVGAPTPEEDAADVISLFSDAYTNVGVDTWRTDWSSATYEEVDIDGNPTKKYTNLTFVGVETTGANLIDASGMNFVHVDIWTPNMESFRIKLVDFGADNGYAGGDDTEHEITITDFVQNEWNSFKIPLSDFPGLTNRTALAQHIFAGTPNGSSTLYLDNYYFSAGEPPVNTLALPVTFEDTEQDYALIDFGGNASAIVEDPTDASNTVAQSTKTAGSQTWAGTTVGGAQGFAEPIPFTADSTTMSVRVWSPNAGIPIRLKVEDAANATISVETEATITTAGEWETLVFDFSNEAEGTAPINLANTYNKASIFFNFGTSGADETYYWDDIEFGGESTEASASNSYSTGWNMVSLPVMQDHNNYDEIFPTALEGTLFGFSGTYQEQFTLTNGAGYWLNFPADADVTFTGGGMASVDHSLAEGWNMIGSVTESANMIDNGGITLPGTMYAFNGTYELATSVEPGEGYWIAASQDGTISISSETAASLSGATGNATDSPVYGNLRQAEELTQFAQLRIESGNQAQTLYFGNELQGTYHPLQLSLPPVPPSGQFDARFADGTWISTDSAVTIELAGMQGSPSLSVTGNQTIQAIFYRGDAEAGRAMVTEGEAVAIPSGTDRFTATVFDGAITEIPEEASLDQNYPNPFNPSTSIRFGLPAESNVTLEVYNLLGQRVATLVDGQMKAGYHAIAFDASSLSSGVYLYRIQAGSFVQTKRMTLLK